MEYALLAGVVLLVVVGLLAKRAFEANRQRARAESRSALERHARVTTTVDRTDAIRRAQAISMRPKKQRVGLKVIGDGRVTDAAEGYRAGYELIVRGIDVQLDMADVSRELLVGAVTDISTPHVSSRITYTTEGFAPYLGSIGSIADFEKYAPFRADRQMWLAVHPDDLEEAYGVLREQGIRLSALHHADQMWWKPAR
jgi:hypothetical protein